MSFRTQRSRCIFIAWNVCCGGEEWAQRSEWCVCASARTSSDYVYSRRRKRVFDQCSKVEAQTSHVPHSSSDADFEHYCSVFVSYTRFNHLLRPIQHSDVPFSIPSAIQASYTSPRKTPPTGFSSTSSQLVSSPPGPVRNIRLRTCSSTRLPRATSLHIQTRCRWKTSSRSHAPSLISTASDGHRSRLKAKSAATAATATDPS